jgi:hypothetical protein
METLLDMLQEWASTVPGLELTYRGYGSEHNIHFRGARWMGFYLAKEWMYMELWRHTDAELNWLRDHLSHPDSVKERSRAQRTCRFRVYNQRDLSAVQDLLLQRIQLQGRSAGA